MENKRIKLTKCEKKLHFVKAIMEVTGKSLLESKNIADLIVMPLGDGTLRYKYGILLLNESSITLEKWEEIVKQCPDIEFEYI